VASPPLSLPGGVGFFFYAPPFYPPPSMDTPVTLFTVAFLPEGTSLPSGPLDAVRIGAFRHPGTKTHFPSLQLCLSFSSLLVLMASIPPFTEKDRGHVSVTIWDDTPARTLLPPLPLFSPLSANRLASVSSSMTRITVLSMLRLSFMPPSERAFSSRATLVSLDVCTHFQKQLPLWEPLFLLFFLSLLRDGCPFFP